MKRLMSCTMMMTSIMSVEPTKELYLLMTSKVNELIIKQPMNYTYDKMMTYLAIMYTLVQYMELASVEEGSTYLWLALPKLEDTLAEVHDPLLEVNLGARLEVQSIYINQLLSLEQRDRLVSLITKFGDCFALEYHELLDWIEILWSTDYRSKLDSSHTNNQLREWRLRL